MVTKELESYPSSDFMCNRLSDVFQIIGFGPGRTFVRLQDGCDNYFNADLTREELLELIAELRVVYNMMEPT